MCGFAVSLVNAGGFRRAPSVHEQHRSFSPCLDVICQDASAIYFAFVFLAGVGRGGAIGKQVVYDCLVVFEPLSLRLYCT